MYVMLHAFVDLTAAASTTSTSRLLYWHRHTTDQVAPALPYITFIDLVYLVSQGILVYLPEYTLELCSSSSLPLEYLYTSGGEWPR